jgi:XisH protein
LSKYGTLGSKIDGEAIRGTAAVRDLFHEAVKIALEKEGWVITDDPLKVEVGGAKFEIDLGAERLLAAEREGVRIAVEIKTFLSDSPITDYHAALGQFLNYRLALELSDPNRSLYLAVPASVHAAFFQREFLQISVERYQIQRIIYDPVKEVIVEWIS